MWSRNSPYDVSSEDNRSYKIIKPGFFNHQCSIQQKMDKPRVDTLLQLIKKMASN